MDLRALRNFRTDRALQWASRQRVWIGIGATALLAFLAMLSFSPLVCALAESQGARRGLQVSVDRARPGWGGLWLLGVSAAPKGIPEVSLQLSAVRVRFGLFFRVRGIETYGGYASAEGSFDDLQKKLKDWRGGDRAEVSSSPRTPYTVRGLGFGWRAARRRGPLQQVWGIAADRNERGEIRLHADLARFSHRGVALDLERPELEFSSTEHGRMLDSAKAASLLVRANLDARNPTAPEAAELNDHARVASEEDTVLTLDPLRPGKLRLVVLALTGAMSKAIRPSGSLELDQVHFRIERGGEVLNFGPSLFRLIRNEQRIEMSLIPRSENTAQSTVLRWRAEIPLDPGESRMELDGGPVSLGSLGIREGDFGLQRVGSAMLQARGSVTLTADAETVRFSGSGQLTDLALQRPELSSQPLNGLKLSWRSVGSFSVDGSRIRFDDAEFGVGAARLNAEGAIERGADYSRINLQASVPQSPCQSLLESVPKGATPLLGPLRLSGTFGFKGEVSFFSREPDATRVSFNASNRCRITQLPKELDPERFKSTWLREVEGENGKPMEIESGPGSDDWVPQDAISPFMETALLVCEDGRFLKHNGFDYSAIESAIRDNLRAGRFVRGASTLSMQLAKNLYLRREKTLSRKLQEAILTLLLEQELEKTELLELYLNVVEFGPGIYGIGPAANYYFNTRPLDLTLAQALYLGSILPNPDHSHFAPDATLRPTWQTYLQRLMRIARERDRISDEQLEAGLAEELTFHSAQQKKPAPIPATARVPSDLGRRPERQGHTEHKPGRKPQPKDTR